MAEPHVITTLRDKRNHIEQSLKAYEAKIEQCRRDLAHANVTLALFAVGEAEPNEVRAYMDTIRLFRRGELSGLCKAALAAHGPQDTRELARRVAEAKWLDAADSMLCRVPAYRIVQALTLQWKRKNPARRAGVGGVGRVLGPRPGASRNAMVAEQRFTRLPLSLTGEIDGEWQGAETSKASPPSRAAGQIVDNAKAVRDPQPAAADAYGPWRPTTAPLPMGTQRSCRTGSRW